MPDQFHLFGSAVRTRFDEIAKEDLFQVGSDRDEIWNRYLGAFPPGSNPVFRKRTEHDCSCCRGFIRTVGNVVAIQNGALATVWDLNGLPDAYQVVADAMASYVRSLPVTDVFLSKFGSAGQPVSREYLDGAVRQWSHFSASFPRKFITEDGDSKRGEARTTHAVLMRGFSELTPEAVATVADLIEQNALYRGKEHQRAVQEFQRLQARFLALGDDAGRKLLAWTLIGSPVARFRNTVIGTLVQDLSEGVDLERAVRTFESKVAPQNYKRPTALITKRMVDDAMATIRALDLEPALERRHARLSDVSVSSVLFVDNAVAGEMKGGVKDLLMQEVKPASFDPSKTQEIGIDEFIGDVIPRARSIRLYLDNALAPNFVSLTAPAHADSGSLFRWGNDFAWAYDGNVADSIRERVKRAGGQVEGVALRVSLAWQNYDDLDLHIFGPRGEHIYFSNRIGTSGGHLDVDMNAGQGTTREPVENIRWVRAPGDGVYRAIVHNYFKRESVDVGFTVEIECHGAVLTYRLGRGLAHGEEVIVADLTIFGGEIVKVQAGAEMVVGAQSRELWGVKTLDLVRVNSILLSPNHWTEPCVGNKHYFFILDGCKNPLPVRGIFNEFLHPRFEKHRKVFEVLGDKTKCPVADEQLSGVGFSSTRKDRVSVVVTGPNLNRAYTVAF